MEEFDVCNNDCRIFNGIVKEALQGNIFPKTDREDELQELFYHDIAMISLGDTFQPPYVKITFFQKIGKLIKITMIETFLKNASK